MPRDDVAVVDKLAPLLVKLFRAPQRTWSLQLGLVAIGIASCRDSGSWRESLSIVQVVAWLVMRCER